MGILPFFGQKCVINAYSYQLENIGQFSEEIYLSLPTVIPFHCLLGLSHTSLSKIPPILLKAGIWIPYFSSSFLMALICSSENRKEQQHITNLHFHVRFSKCRVSIQSCTHFGHNGKYRKIPHLFIMATKLVVKVTNLASGLTVKHCNTEQFLF